MFTYLTPPLRALRSILASEATPTGPLGTELAGLHLEGVRQAEGYPLAQACRKLSKGVQLGRQSKATGAAGCCRQ
jgi:hypothetical protein